MQPKTKTTDGEKNTEEADINRRGRRGNQGQRSVSFFHFLTNHAQFLSISDAAQDEDDRRREEDGRGRRPQQYVEHQQQTR